MAEKVPLPEWKADTLVEIRDILARIHDARVGKFDGGLSLIELAALRDSIRRINEVISR